MPQDKSGARRRRGLATSTRAQIPQETIYINYAPDDAALAAQIATDLQRVGVACWLHEHEPSDVNWAGGVHPALKECARMVIVLSPSALTEAGVEAAWKFVMPILDHWSRSRVRDLPEYQCGTWGPVEADRIIVPDGRQWRTL